MSLVVFTAFCGLMLAPGSIHPWRLIASCASPSALAHPAR
jgi:heme O synthase-like polyprenyltransferase